MVPLLLVLLLVLAFFAFGFSVHLLWVAAVVVFVVWLLGFAFRGGSGRWYKW